MRYAYTGEQNPIVESIHQFTQVKHSVEIYKTSRLRRHIFNFLTNIYATF